MTALRLLLCLFDGEGENRLFTACGVGPSQHSAFILCHLAYYCVNSVQERDLSLDRYQCCVSHTATTQPHRLNREGIGNSSKLSTSNCPIELPIHPKT